MLKIHRYLTVETPLPPPPLTQVLLPSKPEEDEVQAEGEKDEGEVEGEGTDMEGDGASKGSLESKDRIVEASPAPAGE